MQQTVAMLESTLEHDNERPTAIVKPAEYIDQWSGMVFEDQRASNMRQVLLGGSRQLSLCTRQDEQYCNTIYGSKGADVSCCAFRGRMY